MSEPRYPSVDDVARAIKATPVMDTATKRNWLALLPAMMGADRAQLLQIIDKANRKLAEADRLQGNGPR